MSAPVLTAAAAALRPGARARLDAHTRARDDANNAHARPRGWCSRVARTRRHLADARACAFAPPQREYGDAPGVADSEELTAARALIAEVEPMFD